MLFRVRFFYDMKLTFLTKSTVREGDSFQTLLQLYSYIQNGDIKWYLGCENACSHNVYYHFHCSFNTNKRFTTNDIVFFSYHYPHL